MSEDIPLRPYQIEAHNAMYRSETDCAKSLIVHPTGSGKTVTFTSYLDLYCADKKSLVLCHRTELIDQTTRKLQQIAPNLSYGVVQAGRNEIDAQVIVGSVQTLQSPKRLAQLHGIETMIVDEAHHASALSWLRVIKEIDARRTFGFTATAERADGKPLAAVWDKIIHRVSLIDLIVQGYLCDAVGQLVGLDIDLSDVNISCGDFAAAALGERMQDSFKDVAYAYAQYAGDLKGLVYTPTVATAHQLAGIFRDLFGIAAEAVDGTMTNRSPILERFRTGETQVVVNCMVLTEGFDEPSVECICIARPTRSRPLYQQMIGRGLRPYPGKERCLVLDTVGATQDHSLMTLATLAGVSSLKDKSLATVVEAELRAGRRDSLELYSGQSTMMNLFRSKLKWLPVSFSETEAFVLPSSGSDILLAPDDSGWSVVFASHGKVRRVYREGLSLSMAQGISEELIREHDPHGYIYERGQRWNSLPATDPQRNKLRAMGVPSNAINQVKTRGDASNLISRIYARKALKQWVKP